MKGFEELKKELLFKMSRSSGKGGQHVNKVSTRVSVFLDIPGSEYLDAPQKALLLAQLAPRLSKEGILQVTCQKTRSQFKNKQLVLFQLRQLLTAALTIKKPRKKVPVPKSVKVKRRKEKAFQSEKKQARKKVDPYY
ncbi:MAG: alternative ribosome rescue aminoacyl-tRNA hydrolase ArfB [Saprospiraceae bacterium]